MNLSLIALILSFIDRPLVGSGKAYSTLIEICISSDVSVFHRVLVSSTSLLIQSSRQCFLNVSVALEHFGNVK